MMYFYQIPTTVQCHVMLYVHVCKTLKVQVHVYMFVLSVCQDRNEVIGLRMQEIADSLYALKGSYLSRWTI